MSHIELSAEQPQASLLLDAARHLLSKFPDLSLARLTLIAELEKEMPRLKAGVVLDVGGGSAPYRKLVPHTKYMTLDVDPERKPDLCADLHQVNWQSAYFDTIIATEVLEHLQDPRRAVGEMHRLLKEDGVCLLSTRFIHPIHGAPSDYFRFTADGLRHVFSDFGEVRVIPLGNRLLAVWLLATHNTLRGKKRHIFRLLWPLTRLIAKVQVHDSTMPLGYLVVARKRRAC